MEKSKNLKIIGIVIVIIILIVGLSYLIFFSETSEEGMTALEGFEDAKWGLVNSHHQNLDDYRLILVQPVSVTGNKSFMLDDGRFDYIIYVFSNTAFGDFPSSGCLIIIGKGGFSSEYYSHPYYLEKLNITPLSDVGEDYTITDWNIDSDEAFEMALDNDDFNAFMDLNPDLERFALSASTGKAIWYMHWQSGEKSAFVEIDADTGDVLKIEVD